MKKSLLFLSAIIIFASCQKSDHYFNNNRGGCLQHDPQDQQQTNDEPTLAALITWGKNWNYVNPRNVTQTAPYNCYDNVQGDPVSIKQIATADGPRFASAVATYFNGGDWDDLFPNLGDPAFSTDLAKLQSGDYYLQVTTNGTITYLIVRETLDPEDIHFVLAAEEVE